MDVRQHEERVAIVTGGGRGIGRSIVLGVVRAGVHVIATGGANAARSKQLAEKQKRTTLKRACLPWLPMLPWRVTAKSTWIRRWSALAAWIFW
jgi:NAD(P)-dependent dehydrogenase (short-subunit alcohol dehydrogenase family)